MDNNQNPATSPQFAGLRVLLVDDDPVMLSVAAATLGRLGVDDVQLAESGRVALDIVDAMALPPDVIFCDLDMPEMDGIEFLRHISGRDYRGAMVFVSGTDRRVLRTAERAAQARQLKSLGSIEKPMSPDRIAAVLKRVITEAKPSTPRIIGIPEITLHELEYGLDNNEFQLYFQPKVDLRTLEPVGAEALLRWFHRRKGAISPVHFLPLAESSGLITRLTDWVMAAGLRQLAAWHRERPDLTLSMNVSMRDLDDPDWPARFFETATRIGVDITRVTLELTEGAAIGNLATSLEALARLRLRGVRLSIDDFGTGFSSLKKLTDIPFTELKIDRQFIQAAIFDAGARAVSEACAELARELDINCVAEGVETQRQLEFARAIGCNEAQGFLFAPAMPNDAFLAWCHA